jgi:hypothetical protein
MQLVVAKEVQVDDTRPARSASPQALIIAHPAEQPVQHDAMLLYNTKRPISRLGGGPSPGPRWCRRKSCQLCTLHCSRYCTVRFAKQYINRPSVECVVI